MKAQATGHRERLLELMKQASRREIDWAAVSDRSKISELGFDSLSVLDLLYEVQQAFGIRFDAEELAGMETFGELADFLAAKQSQTSGRGSASRD